MKKIKWRFLYWLVEKLARWELLQDTVLGMYTIAVEKHGYVYIRGDLESMKDHQEFVGPTEMAGFRFYILKEGGSWINVETKER